MKHFPHYWPFVRGIQRSPVLSNDHRWIFLTKASDVEIWYFLLSAAEQTVEKTIEAPVIWDAIAFIMTSLKCDARALCEWCMVTEQKHNFVWSRWLMWKMKMDVTLQWRHNGRDSVSNHQPHDCLLNRLFRRRSNKTSKLRFTGLCVGNSPGTGEFPAQMASNAEDVSIWWRHHELPGYRAEIILKKFLKHNRLTWFEKIGIALFYKFMPITHFPWRLWHRHFFRVTGTL